MPLIDPPSDRPATEAILGTKLAGLRTELDADIATKLVELEGRLTNRIHDGQVRLIAILLSFTTAYLAVVVGAVVALR